MRLTAKGIRVTVMVFGMIVTVGLMKLASNYLFAIHRYSFALDPLFSNATRGALIDYIQHNAPGKKQSSLSLFFEQLRAQFPYVQSLSTELIAPGVLHCTVQASKPMVTMNNSCVLADSGIMVNCDVFAEYKLKTLHGITTDFKPVANSRAPLALIHALQSMSPVLFMQYTIAWVNEFEVWLHDKNKELFSIMCSADAIPDTRIINYCEMLKNEIAHQGTSNRMLTHWIADVRFNKQIILFAKKGG